MLPSVFIRLTVNGEPYENQNYTVTNANDDEIGTGTTETNGEFTLKAGQNAVFSEVPVEGDYKVKELKNQMPEHWYQVSASGTEGAVVQPLVFARFINGNASFVVSKKLQGEDLSEDILNQDFTFTLKKEDGSAWADAEYYLYTTGGDLITDENGEALPAQQTGENGEFTLKSNQSALFMGIAEGTKYTVTEKPTEHYIQTLPVDQEGYVNKVVRPSVESLPFVNEYEENLLSLEILKKNSVSDPEKLEYLAGVEFELYSDEECTTFAALNSEGETAFTTGEDGRLVIADLSDGIYFLKETKAPDGYIAAKDPIKIVLSKYGDCIVDGQFAEIHMENDTPDTLEDDNTLSVDVINRKVYQIPITGGLGMNMLYLISGCLVLGGIALYLVYRKKHA